MNNSYKFLNDTLYVGQPSVLQLSFKDSVTVNSLPNVLGVLIVDSVKKVDSSSTVWNVNFSTYKLGVLNFDSLKIPFVNSKGKDQALYLNGTGPVIGTSILDTNFKSNYFGYADYPLPKGEVAAISIGLIILIAIISLAIYKFIKREKPVVPKPFYEDPEKTSKEKYDELMNMNLWKSEDGIKEHYFILSEILKYHFSVELKTSFMEQTTSEILTKIKDVFQYEEYKKIKNFFESSDIVKYTTIIPSEDKILKINSEALSLISIINNNNEDEDVKK